MMNRILFAFGALSALFAAAACQSDNSPLKNRPDPQARTADKEQIGLMMTRLSGKGGNADA